MWMTLIQNTVALLPQAQFGSLKPPVPEFARGGTTEDGVLKNADNFISYLFGLLTVAASVFFVVQFLLAVIGWITAGGDSGKITKARDQMLQSVIALVIVVASYGLIGLIGTIVGLRLLEPFDELQSILP